MNDQKIENIYQMCGHSHEQRSIRYQWMPKSGKTARRHKLMRGKTKI